MSGASESGQTESQRAKVPLALMQHGHTHTHTHTHTHIKEGLLFCKTPRHIQDTWFDQIYRGELDITSEDQSQTIEFS